MALTELLVAAAVSSLLAAGLLTGIVTLQRSFRAAEHHAKSQVEQTRLLSYISRDLRRATWIYDVDSFDGSERLTMEIPDYYDENNKPRDPRIKGDTIEYSNPVVSTANPVTVRFYKSGTTLFRSLKRISTVGGVSTESEFATALATNVRDFAPEFTKDEKSVHVSISFVPKFQLNPSNTADLRAGTKVYAETLLRNKQRPPLVPPTTSIASQ